MVGEYLSFPWNTLSYTILASVDNIHTEKMFGDVNKNGLDVIIRFLLRNRIPEGETLRCEQMLGDANILGSRSFIIVDEEKTFECAQAAFNGERLSDVEAYITARFRRIIKIFISTEERTVYVWSDLYDNEFYNILACFVPRMFPWYFKDMPLTSEEQAVISSIVDGSIPDTKRLIEQILDTPEAKAMYKRRNVENVLKNIYASKITLLEANKKSLEDKIHGLYEEISSSYAKLREAEATLFGYNNLQNNINESTDEFGLEAIIQNPKVTFFGGRENDSSILNVSIHNKLCNWDEDTAKAIYNNKYSIVNHYNSPLHATQVYAEAFRRIFIEESVKLNMYADFIIDLSTTRVRGWCDLNDNKTVFPNPHLNHYNCLGTYEMYMKQALQKMDLQYVIDLCMSVTGNINLNDSHVLKAFVSDLFGPYKNNKCLELNDGTQISFEELATIIEKDMENEKA